VKNYELELKVNEEIITFEIQQESVKSSERNKKRRKCSNCREEGHDIRGCPKKNSKRKA